jgi:O-acetyl-ADP-ribose deacetylase
VSSAQAYSGGAITVVVGDLTSQATDAIVCPANSYGHMRGGVAQAIRLAGGDVIEEEVRQLAPVRVGTAVATNAGQLPARRVYHAPTMTEPIEAITTRNVELAVNAALHLSQHEGIRSLSLPGMGTGTGIVPYEEAAAVMVSCILTELQRNPVLCRIDLVAYTAELRDAFQSALKKPRM